MASSTYGRLPEQVSKNTDRIDKIEHVLDHISGQMDFIVDYVKRGKK